MVVEPLLKHPLDPMSTNTLNLAYKFIAISLMLQAANLVATKSGFSLRHPLAYGDIRPGSHFLPLTVPRPDGSFATNFTGSLVSDKFFFGYFWGQPANFFGYGSFTPIPRNL